MKEILEQIVEFLDSKKAENIQIFDMSDKDYFVNHVIIATTLGERHSNALLDDLKPFIKSLGEECLYTESSGDWAILDLGDSLIHLLSSDYRAKYDIESFLKDFEQARNT